MNYLYEVPGWEEWAILFLVTISLVNFNELGRSTKWGGILLFILVPIVLTVFFWPETAAPGNEYGTGTWFDCVKTYSALTGVIGFMAIRYIPSLAKRKWVLVFPAAILGINMLEACFRDFQVYSFGIWEGAYVDNLWVMSGP